VLLYICFFLLSLRLESTQLKTPESLAISESLIESQLLALTPEQIPKLVERARDDDLQAACVLGVAYHRGTTIRRDPAEAIKWLTRAAEHGIAWIQNLLGQIYRDGAGIQQDYSEAVHWYRAAAEQHHPAAADNLGYMYLTGSGVPKDYAL